MNYYCPVYQRGQLFDLISHKPGWLHAKKAADTIPIRTDPISAIILNAIKPPKQRSV
jgi:hypothetical protein